MCGILFTPKADWYVLLIKHFETMGHLGPTGSKSEAMDPLNLHILFCLVINSFFLNFPIWFGITIINMVKCVKKRGEDQLKALSLKNLLINE